MSIELTQTEVTPKENTHENEWTPQAPPTDLIFDDGEPLESNRHRIAMNVLIEALHRAYQGRNDYFTGGNMFIYYSSEQVQNRDFRGPDFFVVLNINGEKQRQGWVVWEEGGRYPDVIIELMSPSTAREDLGKKKEIYQNIFRTRNYFVYDPFEENSLQGWHLNNHFTYEPITTNNQGWLWCESLGLWLGTWTGTILKETATWLRFYDVEGNLVLLHEELAQQEKQRAEQERQRAEQEKQRADQAESKLWQLQERLTQMGIDIDDLPNS